MIPNHDIPLNAGAALTNTVLNAVGRQFPSSKAKQGDDKLRQARDLVAEVRPIITENELKVVEGKFT